MKILVPVKRVVDYNVKIRVKADGTGVETVPSGLAPVCQM
jgi:electron transfer flavoprotein beta subunit